MVSKKIIGDSHAADKLTDAMMTLDERSQNIIRARWLDDDNKITLQELADQYGVSAERVRQLEKNSYEKITCCYRSVMSARTMKEMLRHLLFFVPLITRHKTVI